MRFELITIKRIVVSYELLIQIYDQLLDKNVKGNISDINDDAILEIYVDQTNKCILENFFQENFNNIQYIHIVAKIEEE